MKKVYFNLTLLISIIALIILFVYSGLEVIETKTETMMWKSGKFIMTDLSKVIAIILILTLPMYLFIKRKCYTNNNLKN